jgi:hypothetical protein
MELTERDIARFWSKVNKSCKEGECWTWQAGLFPKGYGSFKVQGRHHGAHRISYLIHKGEIIDGLCICHDCDNPACVNINHLFAGTVNDNNQDMIQKGRQARVCGSAHGSSKLNMASVLEIRNLYKAGLFSAPKIANMYGVGQAQIYRIIHHLTWRQDGLQHGSYQHAKRK